MTTAHPETDFAIALDLDQRRQSEEDAQAQQSFDESLARILQDDEIDHTDAGSGFLPAHESSAFLARLERRVSERLAEAGDFIRHIPRTISSEEASGGLNDTSADCSRLQQRLRDYSLCERVVKGDGNCQFRALSDQLYRNPRYYTELRRAAVEYLREHADMYSPYVEGDFEDYCRSMAEDGSWGDHVTLQAVSDHLGVKMYIITSYEQSGVIEITPHGPVSSARILYLSFWAEVHYNSVFPATEPPLLMAHKDKTLGSKRLYNLLH